MLNSLSKSSLQSFLQCERRFWLELNRPQAAEISEISDLKFNQGRAFGEAVRGIFPGGQLIQGSNPEDALKQTSELWESFSSGGLRIPVFEAAFRFKDVIVYADVLLPTSDKGWCLIEVKSGKFQSADSVKPHYIRDAAIQAWVLEKCGVQLSRIELGQPNGDFVLSADRNLEGLLTRGDITDLARAQFADVEIGVEAAARVMRLAEEPKKSIGAHCKKPYHCPFIRYCSRATLGNDEHFTIPVWHLSSDPTSGLVSDLMGDGYRDLANVPESRLKRPMHRIMRSIAQGTRRDYIDPKLLEHLRSQPFPRYFLDYETGNSPIPMWVGVRAGETIPFQFSVHKWTGIHGPIEHHHYLADSRIDPREELALALTECMEEVGPVFAWNGNSTEGPITAKLAALFPERRDELMRISESCRANDPVRHFREWFYHPLLSGSWGLKSVAAALLPKSPYQALLISNGVEAMAAYEQFLDLADSPERDGIRDALLLYCDTDTGVMLKIWQVLEGYPSTLEAKHDEKSEG